MMILFFIGFVLTHKRFSFFYFITSWISFFVLFVLFFYLFALSLPLSLYESSFGWLPSKGMSSLIGFFREREVSASTDDAVCRIAFSLYLCFPFVLRLTWVSYSNCAYTYIYMYIFYAVRSVLRIFVIIIFFSFFSSYFGYLLLSLLSLLLLYIYIHIDLLATYYYSCM